MVSIIEKRNNQEWKNTKHNTKTPLDIHKTPEEAYIEYKDLFYNSDLSIRDIYERIGVPQTQNTHYTYIRQQAEKEGLNANSRRLLLKHGGRPKGTKSFKNLSSEEQEELLKEYEEKYQLFLEYFEDLTLSVGEILKLMGTHHKSNLYKYIKKRLNEDGLSPTKRQGKVIGHKIRKRSGEKLVGYEDVYQEYKKLYLETDLTVKDIHKKLNIKDNRAIADYIRGRSKEDDLPNAYKRRFKLHPPRKGISKEEESKREELYQEYKRLFNETDKSLTQIYKSLGVTQGNSGRATYIKQRAKEEGLDGNIRKYDILKKRRSSKAQMEEIYQEYKKLFLETDCKINDILEKLNVKINSHTHNYIREHAKKDGLDGNRRRSEHARNKIKPVIHAKPRVYESQYSSDTLKCVEDSNELLEKVFLERNIKISTRKGYIVSISHWFEYHNGKYSNLKENIDFYVSEEDKRIPMRERSIKKDLIGFREYLLNLPSIESNRSLSSYFSKVGSIFRHFGLEMPDLPPVKMDKGYVSNFKDLPTHDMIRTAVDQSPLSLKSLILFMSSSGSAKAETLSITIGMFLKGCWEYTKETPSQDNISECINELKGRHDIVPMIYLRRLKTDKWYYTCCSPEASYMIFKYLASRNNLKWDDKLFPFKSSLVLTRFQEINDNNNWGRVGHYRRFRGHALRKFMASNIGLPRDQVDSFQGRSKDMIQEAYFKQDPEKLKQIYLAAMHNILIYDNWGYGTTAYDLNNEITLTKEEEVAINDEPITPAVTKSIKRIENPVNTNGNVSISQELLNYAALLDKNLISRREFNQIKGKLLGDMLN